MPSESLYSAGWRQGTVLRANLTVSPAVRDVAGVVVLRPYDHPLWAVVTQDCSLNLQRVDSNTPAVELRQVLDIDPPLSWGIHSRKFLLDDAFRHYLVDDKPAMTVSPRLLSDSGIAEHLYWIGDARVLGLKTWLGNRYDRPAVPDELVPLGKAIAVALKVPSPLALRIRDIYMTFGGTSAEREYSLYAVVTDDADTEEIRKWLVTQSFEVPVELGALSEVEALRSDQITLQLIESSYCADLSQLTWDESAKPQGAY